MAKTAAGEASVLNDREHALDLFRQMALIRRFEERTEEQYTRARIGGYCHLAIGEEASSVGAIDALVDGDALYASYRDHGTALAVGSPAAPTAAAGRCTCSTSSATSTAVGASSGPICRSPPEPPSP